MGLKASLVFLEFWSTCMTNDELPTTICKSGRSRVDWACRHLPDGCVAEAAKEDPSTVCQALNIRGVGAKPLPARHRAAFSSHYKARIPNCLVRTSTARAIPNRDFRIWTLHLPSSRQARVPPTYFSGIFIRMVADTRVHPNQLLSSWSQT